MVVIAIMGLVAGGIGIAVFKAFREAQVKTATTNARTLRGAVRSWWVTTENSGCPTVDQLVADRVLDEDSPRKDPWGSKWRIECSEDRVSVSSDGPDKKQGTEDDIRVPPLGRTSPGSSETGS